jgi:hypothetical protein
MNIDASYPIWFESTADKTYIILCKYNRVTMYICDRTSDNIISETRLKINLFVLIFRTIMEYKPNIHVECCIYGSRKWQTY